MRFVMSFDEMFLSLTEFCGNENFFATTRATSVWRVLQEHIRLERAETELGGLYVCTVCETHTVVRHNPMTP